MLLCLALLPQPRADDDVLQEGHEIAPGVYQYVVEEPVRADVVIAHRRYGLYELRVLADEVERGTFRLQTVEHLARTHNPPAVVAINGETWTGDEGTGQDQYGTPVRSVVTYGTVQREATCTEAMLKFDFATEDDTPIDVFRREVGVDGEFSLERLHYGLGSSTSVLTEGTGECAYPSGFDEYEARSAIGWNDEIIAFISTSQANADADVQDLCEILKAVGAHSGVMLDGGPSSALVVNGANLNPISPVFNTPAWLKYFNGDGNRFVADAIGLVQVGDLPEGGSPTFFVASTHEGREGGDVAPGDAVVVTWAHWNVASQQVWVQVYQTGKADPVDVVEGTGDNDGIVTNVVVKDSWPRGVPLKICVHDGQNGSCGQAFTIGNR